MKRLYHLPIIIERDNDGYFAFCPALQGCYTQGDTYEEALANIKDAAELHIEDRSMDHDEMREPQSMSLSMVEVAV
ncbi:MAG: type II toxin-antitoxin system HicB family antitoxin [Parcubacteria group bacterium CG_4_9_14_0_2_um_filter_41_8]|nr:MAG: HicB family protein [Parcubacteria group bacterium CG11_big_fil_rev_8_21_14_0_20_41_14]PIR56872.1 MAG: type II toxin-antitoxin system HicB family antitoxin [Parcubacteria group bacterium CG10_big_fil_rev_8_21_14_0_10_41_35]PIZ78981.1 MAG: type II toxin-antitoxin system HicB family antitoxin [Parcubacteria group bacterium CG_4_10_14_0_2_um_filter_41_6]PJC40919.1 MAG: type II toxin-antitoxin system HicB family antitoxin [Parcubacteria group bacterium CG_4_9_14_0_2_um_filter_41_8]